MGSPTAHEDDRREIRARQQALRALRAAPVPGPEAEHLRLALCSAARAARLLERAKRASNRASYPKSKLGTHLRDLAQLLGSELPTRAFYLVHAGFDTHSDQPIRHAHVLREFDEAMHAFLTDLEARDLLDSTLVMTTSEFGRRVAESGHGRTAGTDHGAASLQMFFGGSVQPGIFGGQPDLARVDEFGNLTPATDFRRLLRAVLDGWLDADARAVLGADFEPVELLQA